MSRISTVPRKRTAKSQKLRQREIVERAPVRSSFPFRFDASLRIGGIGAEMEFLEAIRDPMHEEHIAMWRWCGGPFEPAGFDVNAVNSAIRKLRI